MHGTASMLGKELEIKLELDAASLPALKKIRPPHLCPDHDRMHVAKAHNHFIRQKRPSM